MKNKSVLVRLSPEAIKFFKELSKKTTGKESVSQGIEILRREYARLSFEQNNKKT